MNKTNYIGWTFLAGLLLVSSCNDATDSVPQDEIRLTSAIVPSSRSTDLHLQSTKIAENRQVGVTITKASEVHNNKLWLADGNGTLVNVGNPVYWRETEVTVTAYHPYRSDWTGTGQAFSVQTDQSTDDGYLDSDLLWAQTVSSQSDVPVALNFTHKLAKVNVTLTSDDITDLSNIIISICGTNICTGFNSATGILSATATQVADIKASVTTATAYTASAVIIPQTVAKGTKFVKITYDGSDYYYTLSDAVEFKSGVSYHFQLKLSVKNGNGIGFVFDDGEMTDGETYDFTFEWAD